MKRRSSKQKWKNGVFFLSAPSSAAFLWIRYARVADRVIANARRGRPQ